jgi:hypothetical protein
VMAVLTEADLRRRERDEAALYESSPRQRR